jgi:hypothetical protein
VKLLAATSRTADEPCPRSRSGTSRSSPATPLSSTPAGASYGTRSQPATPGATPAAEFLIAKDPILLVADTAPVEVSPNPDKLISLPIHQMALMVYGVHLLENLKLDELAAKNVSEFALVKQPLKLWGATGSTVTPASVK